MIAGGLYLAPEVAIAKGISGAVISGGANSFYQYLNLKPGQEFNYYDVATATGAGYLAPGYNVPVNIVISTGATFLAHGPDTASLGGAIIGTLGGGVVGKFAPIVLRPVFGTTTGFWAETGSAFASEISSDTAQKTINKAGAK